jgi:hypothetical protein
MSGLLAGLLRSTLAAVDEGVPQEAVGGLGGTASLRSGSRRRHHDPGGLLTKL